MASVALAALLLAACGGGTRVGPLVEFTDLPPGTPGSADSAASAIKGADIVVVGVVVTSQPGRVVGPEGEPGVAFVETQLTVTEVVAQRGDARLEVGDVVVVETEMTPGGETQIAEGAKIFSALWLKRDEASAGRYYRPIHRDAWLMLDPSGKLTSLSTDRGDVAREFETLTLESIRSMALSDGTTR